MPFLGIMTYDPKKNNRQEVCAAATRRDLFVSLIFEHSVADLVNLIE